MLGLLLARQVAALRERASMAYQATRWLDA
jgi:hypothetical protein